MKKQLIIAVMTAMITSLMSTQLTAQKLQEFITNGKSFKHLKRTTNTERSNPDCPRLAFRKIDGTCNNLTQVEFGATDIELMRSMEADYGSTDAWNAMSGENRPSARAVSNNLCDQEMSIPSSTGLSSLTYAWGQFLDHDIDLTPESENEYVPILLPEDEPLFQVPIPFHRSHIYDSTGIYNARQQENIITSWIDASNVYGSDEMRANWLRTFVDGKLKISTGNLLPYNTTDGEYESPIDLNAPSMAGGDSTTRVFVAGDVRANEQPGLTALHTLFVREHNRVCEQLISFGVQGDEILYQLARKQIGATIQVITYEEFLPALGIELTPYTGYDDTVQPDIMNVFASAAYRLGHTMVASEILLMDDNCQAYEPASINLFEGFFNSSYMVDYGIDPILKGLHSQVQEEVDLKIIDDLRDLLFPNFESDVVFGLDLAALNIQRGRDHGLPDYKSIRAHFTNESITSFDQISTDPNVVAQLMATYDSVDDIDPWVGMLAENQMPNKSVGPCLNAILINQFEALRDADFYYYENDPFIAPQMLQSINNTSLSSLIHNNTDLTSIGMNAFIATSCPADEDPNNDGDNDGPNNGDNDGPNNGDNDGPNNGDNDGPNNGDNDGPNNGDNDGPNNGDNDGPNNGDNDGSNNGDNDGPNDGDNDGPNNGGNDGPNNGDNDGPNNGGNDGPNNGDNDGPNDGPNGGGNNGGPGPGQGGDNNGRPGRPGGGGGPGGPGFDSDANGKSANIITSNSMRLYPNPTYNQLNIEIETTGTVQIQLMNINGEIMAIKEGLSSGVHTLDVSALPSGVYLLHYHDGVEMIQKKVIIQH